MCCPKSTRLEVETGLQPGRNSIWTGRRTLLTAVSRCSREGPAADLCVDGEDPTIGRQSAVSREGKCPQPTYSGGGPAVLAGPPVTPRTLLHWSLPEGQEFLFLRTRVATTPTMPMPSNAMEAGSGTGFIVAS
jgi:hypothetical protein